MRPAGIIMARAKGECKKLSAKEKGLNHDGKEKRALTTKRDEGISLFTP